MLLLVGAVAACGGGPLVRRSSRSPRCSRARRSTPPSRRTRDRGLDVERHDGKILLDARALSSVDRAPYDAVHAYVGAEPYVSMRAALR
jgi:hypothetical protein